MSTSILTVRTNKPLDKTAEDLQEAVVRHKFGVMGTHDLQATMAKKGVEFARQCLVFEVCNPHQAKKVLEENMEISTALPCRISLYVEGGETVLATLRPTAMFEMFDADGAAAVAGEVEATITAIIQEAAE